MMTFGSEILTTGVVLTIAYCFVKEWRWSKSISKVNARPPRFVRVAEISILGLFCLLLVLPIVTGHYGVSTTPLLSSILRERLAICGIIGAVGACGMTWGMRRSIPVAAAGVIVCMLVGNIVLASTGALSVERFRDDILRIPLPVEISLDEPLSDVDVVINGVQMGKAPLTTTTEEIDAKAPKQPEPAPSESFETRPLETNRPRTERRGDKVSVDRFLDVGMGSHNPSYDFYVRFERKGRPVTVSGGGGSGGSVLYGPARPYRMSVRVEPRDWDRDINVLLDKARLSDYHVDAQWAEAADTYFHFVRDALVVRIPNEPQLRQVLTDWASRRYRLDQVSDAASAWRAFEAISNEADQTRNYRSNSTAGDAIDLLLDRLDPNQVVALAEAKLAQRVARRSFGFAWQYWANFGGRPYFATSPDLDFKFARPREYVLADTVWRLDHRWDAEGVAHDNVVERRLVPLILQLGYLDPNTQKLALELGGSTIDEFNRKQAHDIGTFEPGANYDRNEYVEGQNVNRAFWQSVNSTDSRGAAFRRTHSGSALSLADQMLTNSFHLSAIPQWMNFLFMDVEGREPLARDFLPTFQSRAKESAHHGPVELIWSYLARMRPLPKTSEFVEVFSKYPRTVNEFANFDTTFSQISPELRFEVARECMEVAARITAVCKPDSVERITMHRTGLNLIRYIAATPTNAAADFAVKYLDPENPAANSVVYQLTIDAKYGNLSAVMFDRLATSTISEHRQLVIPQIRATPNATNREALDRFLKDDDQSVRELAEKVAMELDEIRRIPLPKLN